MNDIEIYDLSAEVIAAIQKDVQELLYDPVDGELKVLWDERKVVNAWAASLSDINSPPKHEVGIHYELLRVVYRDIETYFDYGDLASQGLDKDILYNFLPNLNEEFEVIPSIFDRKDAIKNAFIGALTWIFFHELTHLEQEHGLIRNNSQDLVKIISEVMSGKQHELTGLSAAVSHLTELAADMGATSWCIAELYRHFKNDNFFASLQIFVIGISCLIYRFHGPTDYLPMDTPKGTHPIPITRLELILPQIWEMLTLIFTVDISREELVYTLSAHSTSVGLYWLRQYEIRDAIPEYFFLEGPLNRTSSMTYFKEIIPIWDQLSAQIKLSRRNDQFSPLLTFTNQFRQSLGLPPQE